MTQKKNKPADTKGKTKSDKPAPSKAAGKPAVKAVVAKVSAKPAAPKGAIVKAVAPKAAMPKAAAPAAVKRSPAAPTTTTKNPAPSGKVVSPSVPAKTGPAVQIKLSSSSQKVDMAEAAKKADAAKATAAKATGDAQKVTAKPQLKPVVAATKPVVAVKPIAQAVKVAPSAAPDAAAAKPMVAAAKPVAVAAKPAAPAPIGKPPIGKPMFAPRPAGVAAPATAKPALTGAKAPIAAPVAAAAPAAADPKKPIAARHGFKTGEWIVYPAQGVGRIVAIEEQEIAGMKLELFVITFEKDKMTLRVPTGKAQTVGMRKLAEDGVVKRAMETLKGKARIKRTMWSRRAQEFEAKINSGDLVSVAEVVRDLYRAESQPEQSYSERLLFERALDRMAREIAAVDKLDERGAAQRIVEVLSKSAKARRPATEDAAPATAEDDGDEATAAA